MLFKARGDLTWSIDQRFISILITKLIKQRRVKVDKKDYIKSRLDRIFGIKKWLQLVDEQFSDLTDAHCFHDDAFKNIRGTKALNKKLFNKSLNALLNSYFDEYIAIRNRYNFTTHDKNNSKVVILKNLPMDVNRGKRTLNKSTSNSENNVDLTVKSKQFFKNYVIKKSKRNLTDMKINEIAQLW